ncbi:MAG: hypothetical protein R2746_09425 [Acidimicrobiales bacterium]
MLQRTNYCGVHRCLWPPGGCWWWRSWPPGGPPRGAADALGRDPGAGEPAGRGAVLVAALGFGLLGAFDDLAAHGDDRGFKGHVTSLLRGRLTTGGLAGRRWPVAVVVHATGRTGSPPAARSGADRCRGQLRWQLVRPGTGRTTKVALLAGFVVVAAASAAERPALLGTVAVLGAGSACWCPTCARR